MKVHLLYVLRDGTWSVIGVYKYREDAEAERNSGKWDAYQSVIEDAPVIGS